MSARYHVDAGLICLAHGSACCSRWGRARRRRSDAVDDSTPAAAADASDVQLTQLSFVPGAEVEHCLHCAPRPALPSALPSAEVEHCPQCASARSACTSIIKETWTLREEGGVCNFTHSFIAVAQALARAHVAARGGNAALMYQLTQVKLIDNTYKNHVYALIQLQADAVKLSEPI